MAMSSDDLSRRHCEPWPGGSKLISGIRPPRGLGWGGSWSRLRGWRVGGGDRSYLPLRKRKPHILDHDGQRVAVIIFLDDGLH